MEKQNLQIENYSNKSFIIKGDTQKVKEELKAMGGKWNSRLTDNKTGEKFGAWIFWSDKKLELEQWLNGRTNISIPNNTLLSLTERVTYLEELAAVMTTLLEKVLSRTDTKMLHDTNFYKKHVNNKEQINEIDDDLPQTPPRLLKTF